MTVDVLLVVEARIASVQLIEQVLRALAAKDQITWRTRADVEVRGADFRANTVPVVVRTTTPAAHVVTQTLIASGVPYVFYVDDNFWLLEPRTPIGRHYARKSVRRALDEVVAAASLVVVSTPALADFVSRINPRVTHLDAAIDFTKFASAPRRDDDKVVMGFAGSAARARDVNELAKVLEDALERHPSLALEIIGPAMSLTGHDRVVHFPYLEDYDAYVRFQTERAWDFGLAPLRGTPAQLYKTDVKYREYAAQRIPGIYQRALPYAHILDGETGLLASTPGQWADAIDRYVTEPELRSRIRENAWHDVWRRYAMDAVAPRWLDALGSAPNTTSGSVDLSRLQERIDKLNLVKVGMRRRMVLLYSYGIDHLHTHGVVDTARRTLRFLWRRLTRQT